MEGREGGNKSLKRTAFIFIFPYFLAHRGRDSFD